MRAEYRPITIWLTHWKVNLVSFPIRLINKIIRREPVLLNTRPKQANVRIVIIKQWNKTYCNCTIPTALLLQKRCYFSLASQWLLAPVRNYVKLFLSQAKPYQVFNLDDQGNLQLSRKANARVKWTIKPSLMSVCIFSKLFSIHFLWWWWGEFVERLRTFVLLRSVP